MNSLNNLLLKRSERLWVEQNEYLNAFNYWYYRYFTNNFVMFCIKYINYSENKLPIKIKSMGAKE